LAQMNHSELSRMAGAVDDSTINIVEVIIIIIIISDGAYVAFCGFLGRCRFYYCLG